MTEKEEKKNNVQKLKSSGKHCPSFSNKCLSGMSVAMLISGRKFLNNLCNHSFTAFLICSATAMGLCLSEDFLAPDWKFPVIKGNLSGVLIPLV